MHINCGVSCHNDNENSEAFSTGLRLKLDPEQLDGRSSANFQILRTTKGVPAKTPGGTASSASCRATQRRACSISSISVRKSGKNNQMPPIATRIVPQDQVDVIADWIRKMDPAQVGSGSGPD